jgi:hypothetical protein
VDLRFVDLCQQCCRRHPLIPPLYPTLVCHTYEGLSYLPVDHAFSLDLHLRGAWVHHIRPNPTPPLLTSSSPWIDGIGSPPTCCSAHLLRPDIRSRRYVRSPVSVIHLL